MVLPSITATALALALQGATRTDNIRRSTVHETHAWQLRDKGFTVVDVESLDASLVASAKAACCEELDELLDLVPRVGCTVDQQYNFAEICHRSPLRWDMRVNRSAFDALTAAAVERASPLLNRLDELPLHSEEGWLPLVRQLPRRPRVLMTGAIVSRPGAIEQRFHADADNWHFFWSTLLPRHRIYNIFIPLCDIDADSCGTQFWPGSHLGLTRKQKYRTAMERSGCIENDPAAMRAMDAPACPAGGLIVADFRTLHRGLPNRGEANPRPIAYAIVGTGGAKDDINFPGLSLRQRAAAIEMAADGDVDLLAAMQEAVSGEFLEFGEIARISRKTNRY